MTEQETRKLLNRIFSVYPGFVKAGTDKAEMLRTWVDAFSGIDEATANDAFMKYAKQGPYPPSIADLMKNISFENRKEYVTDWDAEHERLRKLYLKITGREFVKGEYTNAKR